MLKMTLSELDKLAAERLNDQGASQLANAANNCSGQVAAPIRLASSSLQPGLLTISFENDQQLLERLFLLARVLATQPQVLSAVSLPQ